MNLSDENDDTNQQLSSRLSHRSTVSESAVTSDYEGGQQRTDAAYAAQLEQELIYADV